MSRDESAFRLRQFVFESTAIKTAVLSKSNLDNDLVDGLVGTLRRGQDNLIAERYVHELLESMDIDKKGMRLSKVHCVTGHDNVADIQNLSSLHPWTPFVGAVEAKRAVGLIVKHVDRISELSNRVRQTITEIVKATTDPAFALKHLGVFIKIKLFEPFVAVLQKDSKEVDVNVDISSIKQILDVQSADGFDLVKTLIEFCPSAARSFAEVVRINKFWLEREEMLETLDLALSFPGLISADQGATIAKTAVNSIKRVKEASQSSTARSVIRGVMVVAPDVTNNTLCNISLSTYNSSFARLACDLADIPQAEAGVQGLVRLGLLSVARLSSSSASFTESHLRMFADLGEPRYEVVFLR